MIFQPKSENLTFFSPKIGWSPKKKGLHRNPWVAAGGGDASRNGAELFEIEADFSAKIVTFRLVGGMHPPPPKSATVLVCSVHSLTGVKDLATMQIKIAFLCDVVSLLPFPDSTLVFFRYYSGGKNKNE